MEDEVKVLRRKKKVAGIDDPVVIIQRILNIFRQLHILDDVAKENFNMMILHQPPEIRHMCSILPGGSLLQEYVDELEETRGIAPDQIIKSLDDLKSEEESKDNILANAMADEDISEPQTLPEQKIADATTADSGQINDDIQKQMLMMMHVMQNNMQQQAPAATNATIKADPNFAKEIASAISSALVTSDQERRKETQELTKSLTESQMQMTEVLVKEIAKTSAANGNNIPVATTDASGVKIIDNTQAITKAITESQLEMAKMFLQQNAVSASNSSSNNANNIQINTGSNPSNSPELIGDIIKAQSQLFREMAKEQTKELSAIISVSLRETSQQNNKQLINALSSFQKENLRFFKEQAKNRPVTHYQPPVSDGNTVYEYVEQEFLEEDVIMASEEPSYIKKVLGNVFNRNYDRGENKPQTPIMMTEDEPVEPIIPIETLQTFEEQTTELSKNDIVDENYSELEFEKENVRDDYEINSDGLGLSTIDASTKKKKKKKKKNKNKNTSEFGNSDADNNGYTPIFVQNITPQENKEEKDEWDFDRTIASSSKSSFDLDSSLFDVDNAETLSPQIQTQNYDKEDLKDSLPKLDMSIFGVQSENEETDFVSEISTEENNTNNSWQINLEKTNNIFAAEQLLEEESIIETSWEEETLEDIDLLSEEIIESEIKNSVGELNLEDPDFEDLTFDNLEDSEELTEPLHQGYVSSRRASLNNQITIDDFLTQNTEEIAQSQTIDLNLIHNGNLNFNAVDEAENSDANSEWEWEYEEVSEEDAPAANPIEVQPTSEEDGEWEWEYEEVSEKEALAASPIEVQSTSEEDGEWEWEYEEVSEKETPTANLIEVQSTSEEDGEWEWEYEEVSEEGTLAANLIEAQSTSEEDGEWEWEYEETPDGNDATNISVDKEIPVLMTESSDINFDDTDLTNDDFKKLKDELSDQEDIGFTGLFGDIEQEEQEENFLNFDPYAGGHIPVNNEDLSLNSLQSGSLYFQEDVTKTKESQSKPSALLSNMESDLLLPEFSDDDHLDEPYKLNSDIKP